MDSWQRWLRRPQATWLRRALFQIHLWSGLALGLYIIAIFLSGSALVYRIDLMRTFAPTPVLVSPGAVRLPDAQLAAAAARAHPGYEVRQVWPGRAPNEATEVDLQRATDGIRRLFDPFTGEDIGNAVPLGFRTVNWLLDFHDNLLSGRSGRRANGVIALLVLVLTLSGVVVWWPGVARWRRSLVPAVRANWKVINWSLHSALGFWTLAFVLMWAISAVYLAFPQPFSDLVDVLQPPDPLVPADRFGDKVLYWVAYLHFGRFRGRIMGCGPVCHETLRAVWAAVGVAPPVMAVTGAIMWWNRVVTPRRRARRRAFEPAGPT